MRIDRELDKVFRVTITEKEALMFGDFDEVNLQRSRVVSHLIGASLLGYMSLCSELPYSCQLPLEVEL